MKTCYLHTAHDLDVVGVLIGRRLLEEALVHHEHVPVWDPAAVDEWPHGLLRVQLDELLVHAAWLWKAEAAVLVKDRRQ